MRGGPLLSWVTLGLAGLVTVVALLAPWLAPHDPVQSAGELYAPVGSGGHLLGTDGIGRDLLSRTLLGLRTSWLMALAIVALGLLAGGVIGLVAGAFGGWVDAVLMRITDLFLALPGTLVAIAVAAALGSGLGNTFLAISVVWWPFYARIVRGEVRALAARPHVEAARMAGVGRTRLIVRHLLPGVVPSAVITASLDVGSVVLVLASLSFLGLGQSAPAPELGADTSRALPELLAHWWIPAIPGLAVMALSLVANLAGDAVRDLLARDGR
ncbi:ABC transporter permease [Streptomyces radicis]|uniref:ABC transporter permease n=1 Tax=Streptomyces radicis TaxID=1750517 RepID=A0A3A9WQF6_9ACTN|nr:ABC transporter permease [Streptomyces radicis]RKN21652.1 ABC transporter permease [Streptomyces radicis]